MPKQEEIASTEMIEQVKEKNNILFNHKTAISSHYFENWKHSVIKFKACSSVKFYKLDIVLKVVF